MWSMFHLGRVDDLRSLHARERADAIAAGDSWRITNLDIGLASVVWLVADDPELTQQRARSALQGWSRRGFHLQHYWGALARAEAALYQGEREAAWTIVDGCWPALKQSGLLRDRMVRIEATWWRARTALAL